MTTKLGLALAAIAVWMGLGAALVSLDAGADLAQVSDSKAPEVEAALEALQRATQNWLSARLDETQSAAAALGSEKNAPVVAPPAPVTRGRNRNAAAAPVPNAATPAGEVLVAAAEAVVQRLPGAPLFALVSAQGEVLSGTLWPDAQNVRAEPSVASALLGVARISFWHKEAQAFVLSASPIVEGGTPKGALVVARTLGKETCTELAAASQVAIFGLVLSGDKPVCSVGSDSSVLAAAIGHSAPIVLAQAAAATPMFSDATKVGLVAAARPFRSELVGSQLLAAIDARAAFAALAGRQQHRLVQHVLLVVPLLLLFLLAQMILVRPLDALTNQLSLSLQQNDKHVNIDERQFSGRVLRLAKNINGLAGRAHGKASATNESIASMLGSSADAAEEAPPPTRVLTPPASLLAPAAVVAAPVAKPAAAVEPTVAPAPDRSPLFDDDDFEPTRLAASLPKVTVNQPAVSAPKPLPKTSPELFGDGDRLLVSRSLSTNSLRLDAKPVEKTAEKVAEKPVLAAQPAVTEKALFGDDDRFSTLPELPDLPSESTGGASLSSLSGMETDSALSALQDTDQRQAPGAYQAPPEAPPAGASPWEGDSVSADDPDMPHFREVYEQFVRTRAQCGETGDLPLDRFVEKLKKSRDQVLQKQGAARVRFQVYVKDGKAALKAVAFR